MKIRILCITPVEHLPEVRKELEKLGDTDYILYDKEALINRIAPYHVLIPSLGIDIDRSVLDMASSLKVIATPSTGTDHIDLRYAAQKGIKVISLKDEHEFLKDIQSTAELAWLLIMALVRNLPKAFQSVLQGEWTSARFRGHEVYGKTLGILGYGRLGEMMSRFGQAFRMKVIACDPYKNITDAWVKQVTKEELFANADIVTIHVHLNEETRGLVGVAEIGLMKKEGYLINTSRGEIVDEASLLEALESGRIAGAGLDVLSGERRPDLSAHPLIRYVKNHDNLIITPHLGGVTFEAQAKAYLHIIKKLKKEVFLIDCKRADGII